MATEDSDAELDLDLELDEEGDAELDALLAAAHAEIIAKLSRVMDLDAGLAAIIAAHHDS